MTLNEGSWRSGRPEVQNFMLEDIKNTYFIVRLYIIPKFNNPFLVSDWWCADSMLIDVVKNCHNEERDWGKNPFFPESRKNWSFFVLIAGCAQHNQ